MGKRGRGEEVDEEKCPSERAELRKGSGSEHDLGEPGPPSRLRDVGSDRGSLHFHEREDRASLSFANELTFSVSLSSP